MLKNWTVKTKQIKKKTRIKDKATGKTIRTIKSSALNFGKYLLSDKHKSHLETEIVDLNDARERIFEIERSLMERTLHRQKKGLRGGGINQEATSFVLSIPKDIKQPTPQQWKEIAVDAVKELSKTTGIPAKQLWKQTAAVLHLEKSDDKFNHLNLLIGNVHNNEFNKELTQLKSTYAVKQSFNKSMLKLGVDHKTYDPLNPNSGNVPLFQARINKNKRIEERIRALKDSLRLFKETLGGYINLIINKATQEDLKSDKAEELLDSVKEQAKLDKETAIENHKKIVETEKKLEVEYYQNLVKKEKENKKRRRAPRKPRAPKNTPRGT